MTYCWYDTAGGGSFYNRGGLLFAGLNLFIHSLMYTYYAIAAMGYQRTMAKYGLNMILTTSQILQMVGGCLIIGFSCNCSKFNPTVFVFGLVMYASYFCLFAELFWQKYYDPKCTTTDKRISAIIESMPLLQQCMSPLGSPLSPKQKSGFLAALSGHDASVPSRRHRGMMQVCQQVPKPSALMSRKAKGGKEAVETCDAEAAKTMG